MIAGLGDWGQGAVPADCHAAAGAVFQIEFARQPRQMRGQCDGPTDIRRDEGGGIAVRAKAGEDRFQHRVRNTLLAAVRVFPFDAQSRGLGAGGEVGHALSHAPKRLPSACKRSPG